MAESDIKPDWQKNICPKNKYGRHEYEWVQDNIIRCKFCSRTREVKNERFLEKVKARTNLRPNERG